MELYCENCGQKIVALKSQAGKTCSCPKCGKSIDVPRQEAELREKYSEYELTFLNIHEKEEMHRLQAAEMEALEETGQREQQETEKLKVRRLPWQIDIFLYPLSRPGVRHLAVFIGVPLMLKILILISPIFLLMLLGLFSIVVNIILFLYLYWYLAECIRDSAAGWVRAPAGLGGLPDFSDLIMQTTNIIGCLAFLLLPAMIYLIAAKSMDVFAWLLIIPAIFFYPIGLLSVVLNDSVAGLKWRILLSPIRKTLGPYAGLSLMYVVMLLAVIVYMASQAGFLWKMIFRFLLIYFSFVLAHLTGRFYYCYKAKLDLEV
jgi:DNA-directed RNA polymerase subunit M/transcription elongation factor TFIIS